LNAALGTLGLAGRTVSGAAIGPQAYNIQFPGAGDAPGERNIPFEAHIQTIPGLDPDAVPGIREITYDFQLVYGLTPQGNLLFNAITEEQKQRAREVLELYSRYLGVQFREFNDPNGNIATDWTIATGDPRAVAPNIVTEIPPNGVNGIAGTPNIPSTATPSQISQLPPSVAIVNAATNWGNSDTAAATSDRDARDLPARPGRNYEAAALTIMGAKGPPQATNCGRTRVPGDADIVYGQALHRPEPRHRSVPVRRDGGAVRPRRSPSGWRIQPAQHGPHLYQETSIPGQPSRDRSSPATTTTTATTRTWSCSSTRGRITSASRASATSS
jgi:hypothetical protein